MRSVKPFTPTCYRRLAFAFFLALFPAPFFAAAALPAVFLVPFFALLAALFVFFASELDAFFRLPRALLAAFVVLPMIRAALLRTFATVSGMAMI